MRRAAGAARHAPTDTAGLSPLPLSIATKLRKLARPKNAAVAMRFFKTEPGSYGEGDR